MSPAIVAVLVIIGAAAFLLVWLIAGRLHGGPELARTSPSAPVAAPAPASRDMPPDANAAVDDTDPIVAESKRFIERESRHAGLPASPVSDDGRVHLRAGGSITAEQYQDARRRVQESPAMHQPLPPPPVP